MNERHTEARISRPLVWSGVLAMLSLVSIPVQAGEGFGMMKKSVNLIRSLPPQARLVGPRIRIHVSAQKNAENAIAKRMQEELESEVIGNDTTLTLDSKNPTSSIDVTVLRSDYHVTTENRQETRGQERKDSEKKTFIPKFGLGQASVAYKVVKQSFSVTVKAHDVRANKTLLADTITKNYKQSFEDGNGAPDENSLEDATSTEVVADIVRRLLPTKESIAILLPRGRLDDAVPYAEAGMWNKYLDALLKLSPAPNPLEEAYHQYAMGVAYEALGYSADDLDTSLKYLEKSAMLYNLAAEANPKEVNFILSSRPSSLLNRTQTTASRLIPFMPKSKSDQKPLILQAPLGRVQAALVQYQKLKEATGSRGKAPSDKTAEASTVTNDSIVDMLRAGLSEEIITTTIDSAPHRSLDVTPRGLIQLSEAKASTTLLQHIQALASKGGSSKGKGH
ncbi:MAG: hypothetical protein WB973_20505 [Thermoanaerobaculia bacterium]